MLWTLIIRYGLVASTVLPSMALSASLVRVPDFGSNPSNAQMYIYVPDKLASNPAIVVAVSFSASI
jgi:hypothetical protein